MLTLIVSLLVVALVAFITEQAIPEYARAIRLIALVVVLIILLRWSGLL